MPSRKPRSVACTLVIATVVVVSGCAASVSRPSNHRDWMPNLEQLASARIENDKVTVSNIRNCTYLDQDSYVVHHYDETFDLGELESVDFFVVPFTNTPALAHTMLSFGFSGDRFLAVSVEARMEQGESYSALAGAARQFELMYVIGSENDLLKLRTHHRKNDVYRYRIQAEPAQVRAMFLDVMNRVNHLRDYPEWYDTFTNNCTTNIVSHVNRIRPGRIPWDYRVMLSGYSDRLVYDLGLIDRSSSFAATREAARITDRAERHVDFPDDSTRIR